MIRALLIKELREHGPVLLATVVLSACSLAGMLIVGRDAGGRFTALVRFALSLGTINAFVAASRLFVREYAGQTQLFLETLPIGRTRVFATKWLLGLSWLALVMTGAWAVNLSYQRRFEVILIQDALTTLASALTYTVVLWAFAAMAGMLGRHRYSVWLVVLLGCAYASQLGMAASDIALLRLVGERAAMARSMPAWRDLLVAYALAAGFLAGAAALALVGSGAIASQLARRMTARERVFTLVLAMVAITVLSAAREHREKPPFTLANAQTVRGKHVRVGVMNTADLSGARSLALARSVTADVDALISSLGLALEPSIFVIPQQGLDHELIERAKLEESEGIVLRASPDVPALALRGRAIHDVLVDATRKRALKEDRHVLLDGFAAYWASRDDAAERERLWLRASASRLDANTRTLSRWAETSEQLGGCVADGLAFSVVDALEATVGREALRAFARRLFAQPPDDVRVLFEPSVEELLERAGTSWPKLADTAQKHRAAASQRHADELALVPRRKVEIAARRVPRRGSVIETHVEGASAYWVSYGSLGPWTLGLNSLARLDVPAGEPGSRVVSATLPQTSPRGGRVLVEVEADARVLDCPVRLRAERITVP